jgi:hypothetical protein
MDTLKVLMLCTAITLAGCASNLVPVAAPCPPFPEPPQELMRDPPTLDLVPENIRPRAAT